MSGCNGVLTVCSSDWVVVVVVSCDGVFLV